MSRLLLRLSSLMFALSFSTHAAHASEEDFGDLSGEFNLTSSFNEVRWAEEVVTNLPIGWDRDLFSAPTLIPFPPSNNNLPQAEKKEEPPEVASGLTKAEKAEVRKNTTLKSMQNGLPRKLLKILNVKGACEYDLLRQEITSEGKVVYTLCGKCRDLGWIEATGVGIWQITTKGRYALGILEEKGDVAPKPRVKRERYSGIEEDDFDEEDRVVAKVTNAKKKKPKKKHEGPWPEEFGQILKRDMHLRILKILEVGYPATSIVIGQTYWRDYREKLQEPHNNLKTQLSKGWIQIDPQTRKYSITQAGLNLIAKVENREPRILQDDVIEEAQVDVVDLELEEPVPTVAANHDTSPPPRTRSLNDLYGEEKSSLLRDAVLKKRRLAAEEELKAGPQFGWETLPELTQVHLLTQLRGSLIPSVLSDRELMTQCLVGNFIRNLHQVIAPRFLRQFGIKIDHWLEAYLREHIRDFLGNPKTK